MTDTAYKLLGMAVWRGGRWYARRRYGHLVPSRRAVLVAGFTGVAVLGAVVSLAHKGDETPA
ncbi:MAG TPA: hypothetical protein VHB30_10150 [Solirubrobacteraceae bacterium]|jgi:hypothetical protein|nr:hypothetical protein [Solirubrobacteraceae bacterium]